jgi:restriction endonuclease S subunit
MIKMDEIKQRMKEEYAIKVEDYFSQISELKENERFKINDIEKVIGNGIAAAKDVLTATTEEIIKRGPDTDSNVDSKKKHAPPAEKP